MSDTALKKSRFIPGHALYRRNVFDEVVYIGLVLHSSLHPDNVTLLGRQYAKVTILDGVKVYTFDVVEDVSASQFITEDISA